MLSRFTHNIHLWLIGVGLLFFVFDIKAKEHDNSPPSKAVSVNKQAPSVLRLVAPATDAEAVFVSAVASDERAKAETTFREILLSGHLVDDLSSGDLLQLPVGFRKSIGTRTVEVAISRAEFYAQYASLTVYVKFTMQSPGSSSGDKEKTLYFGAEKVIFTSSEGLRSFKAVLLGDVPLIDSETSYSLILKGAGGLGSGGEIVDPNQCYVEVDCGDFKEAQLSADVIFPRTTLIPIADTQDFKELEGRVKANFKAKITSSIDNLLGTLTFYTPFTSPSLNNFVFEVTNASFDMSNTGNPASMVYPAEYIGDQEVTWRGVYIQSFSVYLPPQFKKTDANGTASGRIRLSANNIMVDRTGFSGTIDATNVYGLNEGRAKDWRMSLAKIHVSFVNSRFREGEFSGLVQLPISNNKSLKYQGFIRNNFGTKNLDYGLTVETDDEIDFNLFNAKGRLNKGSQVTLQVVDGAFDPRANLSGELTVSTSLAGGYSSTGIIKLEKIEFDDFKLPEMTVGRFEMVGQGKVANFPISITTLGLQNQSDGTIKLIVGARLELLGSSGGGETTKGFSGGLTIGMIANKNTAGNWVFKEFSKPMEVSFNGDLSVFKISGSVLLYEEKAGNEERKGFRGGVNLTLTKLGNLTVCAKAEFGSTPSFNYYYVAGAVNNLPTAIPIGGPLTAKGFYGGIYYRMKPVNPKSGATAKSTDCGSMLQSYEVDSKVSFGFKGGVMLGVASLPKGSFDGFAGIEMVFAERGGLASLGLYAKGTFMGTLPDGKLNDAYSKIVEKTSFTTPPSRLGLTIDKLEKQVATSPSTGTGTSTGTSNTSDVFTEQLSGSIVADIGFLMDFYNASFHGEANLFINVPPFRGINQGGSAGRLVMHVDKDVWYVHIGTSKKPMGLACNISDVLKGSASLYMMVGDGVPSFVPPPSDEACQFLGIDKKRYSDRNTSGMAVKTSDLEASKDAQGNIVAPAKGFALGARIDVGIKVGKVVYAEGQLGVGFDFLYNTTGGCNGGALAVGQAYAFIRGEVGIAGMPIAGVGVGAFVQGQTSPAYFTGKAVVEVTILFATLRADLEVEVGSTQCGN